MKQYNHKNIESKWQRIWEEQELYRAEDFSKKEKYYFLIEFPYPSGEGLHVGHPRSYTALDILARKKRMEGKNVLYPIGFDAFGLPSENYAIKTGVHPAITTKKNIETFTKQLKSLGYSFDWSREISTTDPKYYKWTQWIFSKMFERGLAYKKKMPINWCLSCKIGLANEEVIEGKCERCGGETEKREKEQWMLAITKYADRLISDLDNVDYLNRIKIQQINWIGKSEGINFKHKIKDLNIEFEVYDSIPQTHLAQTFVIIAPEHLLVKEMISGTEYENDVNSFVDRIIKKKADKKFNINEDMEGIFTGRYVENYLGTGRDVPIWVASFAIVDYGTGIVGCSAHDERDFAFAKKYNIPLKVVLLPKESKLAEKVKKMEVFYREPDGIVQEPAEFKGRLWDEVREDMIEYIEKQGYGYRAVNYKLRDWVFSRQRYWGEPIPMINCEKCGWVPVPEKDLPVELPEVEKYEPTDSGESPLALIPEWINTKCPKCQGPAQRETDTMPNWAGSSWYFLRYTDPHNDKELASQEKLKYWTPIDWYNGGMEHTTLHLLYSRFWYKFLFDIRVIPRECGSEPYKKRTSHGMILGEGGEKMSKSRGNVVNPDDVVKEFGADTFRMYEMFMGPFDQAIPWDTQGVVGIKRFIEKVWKLQAMISEQRSIDNKIKNSLHKTIKKVTEDIENIRFNTAISQMMILVNEMEKEKELQVADYQLLVTILSPFAPHIAEELWEKLGHKESIFKEKWPEYDKKLVRDETIELVVQVNGKVRDTIETNADISEEEAKKVAMESEKVKSFISEKEIKKTIFVKGRLINIVIG